LIAEVNSISNKDYFAFIQENFNYVDFINMLALNIYLANGSTYYHNYYLYHNSGKWELFPWDMDKTLSYYDWMPYQYHRTSSEWESDNPLIERGFLNRQIFVDIKNRIDELSKTSISPNAILPIITSFGMAIGFILSGTILTEIIFSYPGQGYILYQAVQAQDYQLMQGIFLTTTLSVLAANWLIDILVLILDPRTRK